MTVKEGQIRSALKWTCFDRALAFLEQDAHRKQTTLIGGVRSRRKSRRVLSALKIDPAKRPVSHLWATAAISRAYLGTFWPPDVPSLPRAVT
jgi:hypothetical protein